MTHRSPADDHPGNGPRHPVRGRARDAKPRQRGRSRAETAASSQVSAPSLDDGSSGDRPEWQPNPNPRHPDFEPGNTAALVHGATSPRAIAERAEAVHGELLKVCPWLNERRYLPSVQRYLTATAREQLAHEAYMVDPAKARLLEAATAAARLAWSIGAELGMTPAGHARLRILTAGGEHAEQSLADLAAEGRAIRERAQRRRSAALAPVLELHGTDDQEDEDRG